MNHKWNYRPITPEQAETSQTLAQELGISPILGQLLVQRGITKAADAKKFFRPQLPDLHDPFLMKDMDIAVERLNRAMGKKERILIYGDYDVDGTTAVALVYKFIQQFYSNLDYYIPDRYNEGYGISKKGVDYVASDIVPIMGENRILAYHGLKQLNSNPSIGMKAIIDVCGLSEKEITVSDIVFKIGPRINASGRIQNGKEAVDLLTEKDFSVALEKAGQINQYNETRKDLDKSMTEEANNIVANLEGLADRRSIVLYNEEWHKGVIGIVASRLTEVYYRPAVVLTRTDDMATGSARSVSGFDVYKAIEHCRDLLENFGGHTYAAGLSMKVENVDAFTKRFEDYVSRHILPEQTSAVIEIDAEIDFRDISSKFFNDLKKFNPFGPDNTKPIFCTHHVYDYGTSKVVGRDQEHIKLELVDNKSNNVMNGIAFGQSSHVRYIKTKRSFDICYTIEENTHKRGEVQLQIEDIKPIE